MPLPLSVIMTVHNGEKYLKEAVESILNQTFADYEFIVVDDGSTDGSLDILRSFRDKRLHIIPVSPQIGRVAALNLAVETASGELVAVMDADDISLPERLDEQVKFMATHPDIGVVGTNMSLMDHEGKVPKIEPWTLPTSPLEVKWFLPFYCCVNHPSAVARRKIVTDVGGYRPEFPPAEDYDLWLRCSRVCRIANLSDRFVRYRLYSGSFSDRKREVQFANAEKASQEALSDILDEKLSLRQVRNVRGANRLLSAAEALETSRLLVLTYKKVIGGESPLAEGFDQVRTDVVLKLLGLFRRALVRFPRTAAAIMMTALRVSPAQVALGFIRKGMSLRKHSGQHV